MEQNSPNVTYSTTNSSSTESSPSENMDLFGDDRVNVDKNRYPHCIVWTPIPCITWLFPIIGHMGICTFSGVIRDFAGPYFVSEDCMAFGNPAKYWMLPVEKIPASAGNSRDIWDRGVHTASETYKERMHNLCCDNCHSHVACALNGMKYDNRTSWNMVTLCFMMLIKGRYVSAGAFFKTWLPFLIMAIIITVTLCSTML